MASDNTPQTGWSLRLGSVMGIPIRVHFTFLFLVVWYAIHSAGVGDDVPLAMLFLATVFAAVVLHELGHAWMARRFGVKTREIVLYPIGGIARLENMPGGKAELLIALAGPVVNLLLALALFPVVVLLRAVFVDSFGPLQTAGGLLGRLFLINLLLFFFNLIPAFPMDGGRVLRAGLSLRLDQTRATDIAAAVGQTVSILFGIVGIVGQNIFLMFIALFVFIGASQEALIQRQLAAVRGRVAREAMITRFESLAPQDTLTRAAQSLLATHQQDFPVIDAWNRVVGVLPRSRLLQALAEHGGDVAVLNVMDRDVPRTRADVDLDEVLQMLRTKPGCPVIVEEDGTPIGMITLENLTEFIEISRRSPDAQP